MRGTHRRPNFADVSALVGAELRVMRVRAGYTTTRLAQHVDSHRPIITRIENGRHAPTLETIELIAAVCDADVRDVTRAVDAHLGLAALQRTRVRRPRPAAAAWRSQPLAATGS